MECELKLICRPTLEVKNHALCGLLILCLEILHPEDVIILMSNSSATYLLFQLPLLHTFLSVSTERDLLCSYSYVRQSLTNSCSRHDPTII